jgi:hypothetical protein
MNSAVKRKPKAAADGTPYPPDFNDWSNAERLYWLDEHSGLKCVACGRSFNDEEHKKNCEL